MKTVDGTNAAVRANVKRLRPMEVRLCFLFQGVTLI